MIHLISKINDRNIQRKRESGLTGYVLISALIICLYKLFKHSEFLLSDTVYASENVSISIELLCYTFNILFLSGVMIYQLFPNLKTLNHIKLIKRNKTEGYVFLSMILSYSIGTILILFTFFTKQNPQSGFYWYCISIFVLNLFGWLALSQTIRNEKSGVPKINVEQTKLKNLILVITILVSLTISLISSFFIYNLQIEYKSEIIKITILAYFSYVIIEKMLEVNSNDLFYSKLEAFEYEIKLRQLEDNELIRKEFQQRFSGFLVNEWIQEQIKIAEFQLLTFNENMHHLNSQIIDIENNKFTDQNLENKLKTKLEDDKKFYIKRYKEICLSHVNELEKAIKNNLSAFDDYEKEQLNKLIIILKNEL